jgi:hypothetical protein
MYKLFCPAAFPSRERFLNATNRVIFGHLFTHRALFHGASGQIGQVVLRNGLKFQGVGDPLVRLVSLPDVEGRRPMYSAELAEASRSDCSSFSASEDEEERVGETSTAMVQMGLYGEQLTTSGYTW